MRGDEVVAGGPVGCIQLQRKCKPMAQVHVNEPDKLVPLETAGGEDTGDLPLFHPGEPWFENTRIYEGCSIIDKHR
jgi:hypothetical protein